MTEYSRRPDLKETLTGTTIKALYYHPLKSGRRQSIEVATLIRKGIIHDRELMAVNENTGTFLSQRVDPRLAVITTTFGDEEFMMEAEGVRVTVPLQREGVVREATVHSSKGLKAIDQGDLIAEFVSNVIGKRVRIVRQAEDFVRRIKPEYVSSNPQVSDEVGFADGAAFLLTTEQSAAKVREWVEEDTPGYPFIPIDNYRGNIEVEGFGFPFAEDHVKIVQTGNVRLHLGWFCSRCVETTTDQITGERNPRVREFISDQSIGERQPLYSLNLHRMGEYAPGKKGALFGINMQPEFLDDNPILKVGSPVEIVETQS